MNVAVAVLSYNTHRAGRHQMFLDCLRSLDVGWPVFLWDNGSDDGTELFVEQLGGQTNRGPHRTIGDGMTQAIGLAVKSGAEVVVFSNDDLLWKPGWHEQLQAFWEAAPQDIGICSGLLEERVWYWNTPIATLDVGGVRVLQRATVPGGAWTFRASMWEAGLLRPIPNAGNQENDVPVCKRLAAQGYRLVAADWTVHAGLKQSHWGNLTYLFGDELDRERWQL